MLGFHGFGTNAYGSERQTASVIVQVIRFGGRIFIGLYGAAMTFMRYTSARVFGDPSGSSQTFKLPPS